MTEAGTPTAVAMEFPVSSPGESPPRKAPRRLVERLSESRNPPSSVEEIEAKLRDADLRRQKFHEWLSSKARPRVRSLSWSSQEEDLGRRLEAKLYAAEQKRLSLLQRAQTRLAKLDELRQAAKNGAVQRSEREREELGTKVKSKIQQAEVNRMLLLKTHLQRRADAQERKSQSLMKRAHKENKYKECVQRAIFQKRVAAERKRSTFLEAEKTRAGAKVMRAHRIASSVYHQREIQRRKLREQMEARLSRAKRQRAEHLKQRRNSICSSNFVFNKMRKNGDSLSRKLARCWRQFVRSKKTTYALAKAYEALGINREHVKNMPFEQLAARIGSPATLESVKSLLERFESCLFLLSRSSSSSALENIDHLLKRVSSPTKTSKPNKMPRYPVRVALCAYMIFGHPEAVFSGRGKRETELADKGAAFLQEFELLTSVALKGPRSLTSPSKVERVTFRSQLAAFDSAWRSYLYSFVVWKVKDAKLLEEDLVRTACQMELSMMRKCKLSHEGEREDLNHDLRAIQTQVIEDQQLLRDKVKHLSGSAGVARMESAIAKTRSKYFEKKQGGSSSLTPISQISSQSMPINRSSDSSTVFLNSTEQYRVSHSTKSSQVVRALFKEETLNSQSSPQENEVLVNEMLHQVNRDKSASNVTEEGKIKERIKETMEKAFWDGVTESLLKEKPDYRTLINLVKEVKDELSGMSPKSWKEEINGCIDLDILSQVLDSRGDNDLSYLREVMEYALGVLVKLSAPAKEDEMKKSHEKFLSELAVLVSQSTDKRNASLTMVVRGLRFVLEQIRDLKEEISRAQIQMMEPILRGPPGIEYLQKAFSKRYGPPSEARSSLPLTSQWISSFTEDCASVWEQHTSLISPRTAQSQVLLPPATSIRSGGRLPGLYGSHTSLPSSSSPNSDVPPECKGERVDLMLRLGLLKLASKIDGLTEEITPETFQLNWRRLRNSQSQIQNTIVICTSLLVLRQTLISQALPLAEVEPIISLAAANLSHLIDHNPDVALSEILSSLMSSLMQPQENLSQTAQLMGQMLSKSLQADDPIFMKVSSAIHLATRTLLLGGTTATTPAAAALQRVGSAMLLGRLTVVAESLATMAVISGKVHGAWYAVLVNR